MNSEIPSGLGQQISESGFIDFDKASQYEELQGKPVTSGRNEQAKPQEQVN